MNAPQNQLLAYSSWVLLNQSINQADNVCISTQFPDNFCQKLICLQSVKIHVCIQIDLLSLSPSVEHFETGVTKQCSTDPSLSAIMLSHVEQLGKGKLNLRFQLSQCRPIIGQHCFFGGFNNSAFQEFTQP